MSKWVGNMAHILTSSKSASRQHLKVWASQFPYLHSLKNVVPSSEACLYGHTNGSLTQCQQQSSMCLSQSFPPIEMAKPGQRLGSISMCKRDLCQSLVVPLWQRGLTWRVGLRLIKVAESLLVVVLVSLPVLNGSCGVWHFLMFYIPQPHHLLLCRLIHFPNF